MKVKVIRPKKRIGIDDVRELLAYRELLYYFIWRDFKIRYKQTMIGVLWVLFQPFFSMIVFSIFFGKMAKMPSDGVPYPLFVFSGLLFWQFFSSALLDTSESMVRNQTILTKIYFPRLIIPIAAISVKLVDFLVNFVVFIGIMIYYRYVPSISVLFIFPFLMVLSFAASVGPGLFLASINVKYRDVRYVLPFFVQIMMFLTPVIYPSSIANKYSWILKLNPMTGVIEAARASFLNTGNISFNLLLYSVLICVILFSFGLWYFKKTERFFADII